MNILIFIIISNFLFLIHYIISIISLFELKNLFIILGYYILLIHHIEQYIITDYNKEKELYDNDNKNNCIYYKEIIGYILLFIYYILNFTTMEYLNIYTIIYSNISILTFSISILNRLNNIYSTLFNNIEYIFNILFYGLFGLLSIKFLDYLFIIASLLAIIFYLIHICKYIFGIYVVV